MLSIALKACKAFGLYLSLSLRISLIGLFLGKQYLSEKRETIADKSIFVDKFNYQLLMMNLSLIIG